MKVIQYFYIRLFYCLQVETDMQSKMVSNLKYQFVEDTTTNSNPLSNAWNYLHMTVNGIVLFTINCITHLIGNILARR